MDNKTIIKAYTELADAYDEDDLHDDGINEWLFGDVVLSQITSTTRTALDIGCGVGRLALKVARRGPHVTGIDVTPRMIELACKRAENHKLANTRFVVGDAITYNFNQSFDLIYMIFSLGYLDRALALRRGGELLNSGGKLIAIDSMGYYTDMSTGEMVKNAFDYLRFRRRNHLSYNLRKMMRNTNRAMSFNMLPAWAQCNEIHKNAAIAFEDYQGIVAAELPGGTVEPVTRRVMMISYTKP